MVVILVAFLCYVDQVVGHAVGRYEVPNELVLEFLAIELENVEQMHL
jgi:hypothetical protein